MSAKCYDCGLPYSDPGFGDLVVSHDIWNNHISPTGDEGGLLCPTCMVRAAAKAGIESEAYFRSGPFRTKLQARVMIECTNAVLACLGRMSDLYPNMYDTHHYADELKATKRGTDG